MTKFALLLVMIFFASPLVAEQLTTVTEADQEKAVTPATTKREPVSASPVQKKVEPAKRFNPSEKLRADDAVSFPVDI